MYSNKVVLHFPSNLVDKSIIYRLSRDYDLEFNILKAFVNPKEEGLMVLELKGDKKEYEKAIRYLKKEKVKVKTLSKDVVRDENKCTHCGLCVSVCPVYAFEVESPNRRVNFLQDKCIACGICVDTCPYKALRITF